MVKTPYILAVDDDKDFLAVLSDKLKAVGFLVETALDGNFAIESIAKKIPDLVLMDVEMPNKDGITATTELHNNPATATLKIIFLTNLGDVGPSIVDINRHFAQQVGALDYFKKGGDLDLLVDKIKEVLNPSL